MSSSDDDQEGVVTKTKKVGFTGKPKSLSSSEVLVTEKLKPVTFGSKEKGKGKAKGQRKEKSKVFFGGKRVNDEFEKISFATYAAMLSKGTLCPLEMVREEDQEFAARYLDQHNASMAKESQTDSRALLASPERQRAMKSVQQVPARRKSSWFLKFITILALMGLLTAMASVVMNGTLLSAFFVNYGDASGPKYTEYPLYSDFPTADRRCLPITPSLYHQLKYSEMQDWDRLTFSLESYMKKGFLAFSAFRVGKPYCYMLARDANNQTIAMVNPQVVGVNLDSSVMREERSLGCFDRSKHVTRYREVWVRYQDPKNDFNVIERKFSDRKNSDDLNSFIFQSEYNYLNGRSICDNSEKGADSLLEILREGRSVLRPATAHS